MRRPRPAELTVEDAAIMRRNSRYWWATVKGRLIPLLTPIYRSQDRRDADMMFLCQESRVSCDRHGVDRCLIGYQGLAVAPFDDLDKGLFEQGLALLLPKLPTKYRK